MINCMRTKLFIFNTMIVAFSLLLVSLTNTVIAQQQDLLPSPKSFNNSIPSANMTALSDAQLNSSNSLASQFILPSLFAKNEKSVVSVIATFPPANGSEVNSGGLQNSSNVPNNQSNAFGTGFVYNTKGHIITTDSVIAGSHKQEVEFTDGTIYKTEVIGSNPYLDIAVLLVKGVPEIN